MAFHFFQLVNSLGENYKGANLDKVSLVHNSDVIDFKDAVKLENPNTLSNVDSSDLTVYANKNEFEKSNQIQLSLDTSMGKSLIIIYLNIMKIDSIGSKASDPLIVVVPDQFVGNIAEITQNEGILI